MKKNQNCKISASCNSISYVALYNIAIIYPGHSEGVMFSRISIPVLHINGRN